jgi:hypothetical protein
MWQFAAAAANLAEQCVDSSEDFVRADNETQGECALDSRSAEWREALDGAMRVVR